MRSRVSKRGLHIILVIIVSIFIAVVFWLWRQENPTSSSTKQVTQVDIQKQRDDGVYELSRNFNDFIVREDKKYGYDLFSDTAKRKQRIKTYDDYVVWAKRMKQTYPLLGTADTKIEYANRDAIDLRIGDFDDGIHFILEVDESDKVYTINEIRSYSTVDKPERLYDGSGCYLIEQENSQENEDCPLW